MSLANSNLAASVDPLGNDIRPFCKAFRPMETAAPPWHCPPDLPSPPARLWRLKSQHIPVALSGWPRFHTAGRIMRNRFFSTRERQSQPDRTRLLGPAGRPINRLSRRPAVPDHNLCWRRQTMIVERLRRQALSFALRPARTLTADIATSTGYGSSRPQQSAQLRIGAQALCHASPLPGCVASDPPPCPATFVVARKARVHFDSGETGWRFRLLPFIQYVLRGWAAVRTFVREAWRSAPWSCADLRIRVRQIGLCDISPTCFSAAAAAKRYG